MIWALADPTAASTLSEQDTDVERTKKRASASQKRRSRRDLTREKRIPGHRSTTTKAATEKEALREAARPTTNWQARLRDRQHHLDNKADAA
eukprot:13149787-Alexandrium_andersonii.AAC.1